MNAVTPPARPDAADVSRPTPVNERLRVALAYAADGVPVFACSAGQKTPLPGSRSFQDATTDAAQIEAWWAEHPDANIALEPARMGLCVLDVDPAGIAWAMERVAAGELPPTFTVRTPRGGQHRFYQGTTRPSASKLAPGVDVRSEGSYVLVPPSATDAGSYTVLDDREPAPLPAWIADALATAKASKPEAPQGVDLESPANVERALAVIRGTPGAVEGQGSDAATVTLASAVMDLTSQEKTLELLSREWMPRCVGT